MCPEKVGDGRRTFAEAREQDRLSTCGSVGGPPGTRTQNLRIKSPLLYPIELEARTDGDCIKVRVIAVSRVTEGT